MTAVLGVACYRQPYAQEELRIWQADGTVIQIQAAMNECNYVNMQIYFKDTLHIGWL